MQGNVVVTITVICTIIIAMTRTLWRALLVLLWLQPAPGAMPAAAAAARRKEAQVNWPAAALTLHAWHARSMQAV